MNTNKILIIFLFFSSLILGEEWHVKKSKANLVKFTSSTPVLDFDGTTSEIDGYLYWEGDSIFGPNNELYFEVDLNSIETGIGKRDRDMREDVLETDKWPKTSFRGTITSYKNIGSNLFEVVSKGAIFIHGHKKDLEINAKISLQDSTMRVQCDFSVFLKDYEIEAPSLLAFIKVSEEIKLYLDFQLTKIMESKN